MGLLEQIDRWGGVAIGLVGGEKVAIAFLLGLLEDVTPEDCYRYIAQNKPLINLDTSADWQKYGRWARQCKLQTINTERILQEIEEHRPELHQLITDCPGGAAWLDKQVRDIRGKLGLEEMTS